MRELEFLRERTGVSPLENCVLPNDGMDGVRMRSFVVRFEFVSDMACRVPTAVVTTPLHTGRGRGGGSFLTLSSPPPPDGFCLPSISCG